MRSPALPENLPVCRRACGRTYAIERCQYSRSTGFAELPKPIEVGRRKLRTLHDLRAHLLKLPEDAHDKLGWRAATQALLNAAEMETCWAPRKHSASPNSFTGVIEVRSA